MPNVHERNFQRSVAFGSNPRPRKRDAIANGSNRHVSYVSLTLLFALRRSDMKFWSPLACDAMVAEWMI